MLKSATEKTFVPLSHITKIVPTKNSRKNIGAKTLKSMNSAEKRYRRQASGLLASANDVYGCPTDDATKKAEDLRQISMRYKQSPSVRNTSELND